MKFHSPIRVALALVAISSGAMAAEEKAVTAKQVPQAVHEAFKKAYPAAKDVKYEEEIADGNTVYEIDFKDKGEELEASYAPDGTLTETEEAIKVSELPQAIVQAVKSKYPKSAVKEAEKILKPDGTLNGYEVEIKQGREALELELDTSGKIVKTGVEKEEQHG